MDQALSALHPQHSRARIQSWIKAGDVTVNKKGFRQRDRVNTGDFIEINTTVSVVNQDKPEVIPLEIIYEDEAFIIINKPAGLVVHPGAGNPNHTLVNALLNHDKNLNAIPRAGIIHRLDKDTTGIMVVARRLTAHTYLVDRLQKRDIKREYQTIVCGRVTAGSTIETLMGRHPVQRTKMAVTKKGKTAITHYRIIKKYQHYTHLRVQLETGRTHQIRVHLSHAKLPIVGDPVYGKNHSIRKGVDPILRESIRDFKRQALHAYTLELPHPLSGEIKKFKADLPEDIQSLIRNLEQFDLPNQE